jgi:hypothetical protein
MIPVQVVVLYHLLWASRDDLKSHMVHDLVFLMGLGGALVVSLFFYGFNVLPGMVFQGVFLLGVGFVLRYGSSFGMADVFALGLIGFSVPGPRPLVLAASVLVPGIVYQKVYAEVRDQKAVPLIPGITIGYVLALLVL